MTQYYVLKQEECECKWELTKRFRRSCPDCKGGGIRITRVPLADAIAEVEEQNAEAFLKQQDSPTVGKEPGTHSFTCNVCGRVRSHQAWQLTPNTYIRCPTCRQRTFHTPTVKRETLPCPFCGGPVGAYDGRDCRYCWRSTPVVDAPPIAPVVDEPPYVYPFTCKICNSHAAHIVPRDLELFLRCKSCEAPILHLPSGAPALLTPHSARQSGTGVGDQPYSDPNKGAKGDAGPKKEQPGCPECGWLAFTPTGSLSGTPLFLADGTLAAAAKLHFCCDSCGHDVGTLPLTK